MAKTNTCKQCSKKTSNPTFCSRSCAAKYNNRKSPKRGRKHKCQFCQKPVLSKQKFCVECASNLEALRKNSKDIITWNQDGNKTYSKKIKKIYSSCETVFSTHCHLDLDMTTPIGPIIDFLIDLCFSEPDYIKNTDVLRYASHLEEFKTFKSKQSFHPYFDYTVVAQTPLRYFNICSCDWIRSYWNDSSHPLMCTYAISTIEFIQAHLLGTTIYCDQNGPAIIEPLFKNDRKSEDHIYKSFDPSFKKDITMYNVGQLLVSAQIPTDGYLMCNKKSTPVNSDSIFFFQVKRTHISEEQYYDHDILNGFDKYDETHYNIAQDLIFYGDYLLQSSKEEVSFFDIDSDFLNKHLTHKLQPNQYYAKLPGHLPISWINSIWNFESESRSWIPTPNMSWIKSYPGSIVF